MEKRNSHDEIPAVVETEELLSANKSSEQNSSPVIVTNSSMKEFVNDTSTEDKSPTKEETHLKNACTDKPIYEEVMSPVKDVSFLEPEYKIGEISLCSESETESINAIKIFIENQEREIEVLKSDIQGNKLNRLKIVKLETLEASIVQADNLIEEEQLNVENNAVEDEINNPIKNYPYKSNDSKFDPVMSIVSVDKSTLDSKLNESTESLDIASSVMNIIINESESKMDMKNKELKKNCSLNGSPEKGSAMALSVGSKVEAKDFSESWHPAQILEVDYDEMEVLVRYENMNNRPDEWISVSSPRLRPRRPKSLTSSPLISKIKTEKSDSPKYIKPECSTVQRAEAPKPQRQIIPMQVKEEPKEDKIKLTFEIGERCLVRYKNNMRFTATVTSDFGEGDYQITFDDGFKWNCNVSRIVKWKDSSSSSSNLLPPVVTQHQTAPLPTLPFHTHLFDPARDYLGSKTERRERKRKLNIKEIFNIGMGKKRCDSEEKTPKKPQKRSIGSISVKKKVTSEPVSELRIVTVKKEIPEFTDAVASIIGTIKQETPEDEVKQVQSPKQPLFDKDSSVVSNVNESSVDIDNSELIVKVDNNVTIEIDADDSAVDNEIRESVDLIQPSDIGQDATISEANDDVDLIEVNPDKDLDEECSLDEVKSEIDTKDQPKAKEEILEAEVKTPKRREPIVKLEDCLAKAEQNEKQLQKISMSELQKTSMSEAEISKSLAEESRILESLLTPDTSVPVNMTSLTSPPVNKDMSKVKKAKKFNLIREKKVKKQVEKVKSELEEMKKQVDEMKKQIMLKTEELAKDPNQRPEFPESFLLPGEWCCKWVNGQPVGRVSEIEFDRNVALDPDAKPPLPRRSVQVSDKRLPPGWTKLMVRRSVGSSAGKWDVVLISPEPECRRFHAKSEVAKYLESLKDNSLKPYEKALQDFGIHLKLARRMGWVTETPDAIPQSPLPCGTLPSTSPTVKRKKLSLNRKNVKLKKDDKRRFNKFTKRSKTKPPPPRPIDAARMVPVTEDVQTLATPSLTATHQQPVLPLQDGFVYVGSLKVQIIMNLLRCPAEGCFKNFRTDILLQMHIKHYHPELTSMLGDTPNVIDLASARAEEEIIKKEAEPKVGKVRVHKPRKEGLNEPGLSPFEGEALPRSLNSPFRNALNRPKRPKVLLPVRNTEDCINDDQAMDSEYNIDSEMLDMEPLDFETAISTHTVTKPVVNTKKRSFAKAMTSEDDLNSDLETRSSFPGSDTPDSRTNDAKVEPYGQMVSSESNEEQRDPHLYAYNENGDRIKIEHMKREEIINCHCGIREEDGLMVQCELCLCWQHALCHNITNEALVPEKYTCSICLNPRRGRRSKRFLHDQDRLYEGLLPGAKPCEWLRRSHELSGNLLRIQDALHSLRVKYYVATKKDHPKLYLWAKDWETNELSMLQEKFNSDYSDLNIMINAVGKENLPMKPEDVKDVPMDMRTPPSEEQDRFSQRETQIGPQSLLSGLLSSPSGGSLELPITTSELEKLAKSVQEQEMKDELTAPQPEAAIDNSVCREHLLKHIKRCQALIDARFDSIEAQVAELESQDPSLEDDETADYIPRTKQTVQMLMRDLEVMEELGIIT